MRAFRLTLWSSLVSTLVFSQSAFAAAFQLYELGTPIIGTAAVGQAAVAEDASTAYFNPAGMGLLKSSQFMIGSQLMIPYVNFAKSTTNTIPGDNGGNAGSLTPGMDLYFAYSYSPCLKFGVSLTSPYGGMLNYSDGWVGRYVIQFAEFYTINLNPSIAYRVNDWLSVGAGAAIEYMNLQETVALPILPYFIVDGQVRMSLASFAPGYNLGVMLTPYQSTRIGLAYRSQIIHNLHGNSTFLRIGVTPNTSTRMVMPKNLILSFSQKINQFTLLGELGWANWASMHNTILNVANYSIVAPEDWNNTYRVGLAGQYNVNPCLLLQAGASYDSSPTNESHRLPDLPMDRQVRIGAGVMVKLIREATLGVSYEYINFGRASIDNVSRIGSLIGSYSRNYANTVQVSLNVEM